MKDMRHCWCNGFVLQAQCLFGCDTNGKMQKRRNGRAAYSGARHQGWRHGLPKTGQLPVASITARRIDALREP
jgi:hypothetical protein